MNFVNVTIFCFIFIFLIGFVFAVSPEYVKSQNLTEKSVVIPQYGFLPFMKPDLNQPCYGFIGPKVKDSLNILVNPTNYSGLSSLLIENATKNTMITLELYNTKIFGLIKVDSNSSVDTSEDNTFIYFNKNTKLGKYIPAQTKYYYLKDKMIGANIEFNAKDFEWGDYLQNQNKTDFQGILTHELGHAIGLADVWAQGCESNTMFGMSKDYKGVYELRTLEGGDKSGLYILYSGTGKFKKYVTVIFDKDKIKIDYSKFLYFQK